LTSQPPHSIAIVPIGSFDLELIEIIISRIENIFDISSEILPLLNDLSFALDLNRKRHIQKHFIRYMQSVLTDDPKIDELLHWENKEDIIAWLDSL